MSDKTTPLFFALRKEQGNGFNQTANTITYLIKKLVWKFSLFIKKLNLLIRVFMYMYLRNPYQNINHIIRSSETRLQRTPLCQFQMYGEVRSLCIILKLCTIKLWNITELFLANQIHSSLARGYECLFFCSILYQILIRLCQYL